VTAVLDVLDAALEEPGHAAYAVGGAGAGKSAAARGVMAAAAARGLEPILVAPPSGAPDAGIAAVGTVVRRFDGRVPKRGGWDAARRMARDGLAERAGKVVVVCDEPSSWPGGDRYFAARAIEAREVLAGASATWPVVVCDGRGPKGRSFRLPDAQPTVLRDAHSWGPMASAALALADSGVAAGLRTPLQQRLAVALIGWGAERLPASTDAAPLAAALAAQLVRRRHGAVVWAIWQRLALERLDVDDGLLQALGAEELDELGFFTVRSVLMDGGGRLHDVCRRLADERPVDPDLRAQQKAATHELLFERHYALFAELAAAGAAESGDHAAEALFHATEIGDETREHLVTVDLVDQLNALGHRRSVVHGDHAAAAAVFLRALQADDRNGYALHHRGYALDALGENAGEVETRYDEAIDLDSSRPEWHARRVAFFADLARPSAARAAWARAETAVPDERDDPEWYDRLNCAVAATLIEQGELAFARYVLDGVPEWGRLDLHRRLDSALRGRIAAQDRGVFVPAPRSSRAWWLERPARLTARDGAGRRLEQWLAGRVEEVGAKEIQIHVARVDPGGDELRRGLLRLKPDVWDQHVLDDVDADKLTPGRFIEIGSYVGDQGSARAIAVLPVEPVDHPGPELDPERWLRNAALATADG
jgi:hypothetical protein